MNALINIDEINLNLSLNEIALLDALNKGNTEKITALNIQRSNLKDMLIEALEQALNNKGLDKLKKTCEHDLVHYPDYSVCLNCGVKF